MFTSSSISSGLDFLSVTQYRIKKSESKVYKNIEFLNKISNNWLNDFSGINVYKTLELC